MDSQESVTFMLLHRSPIILCVSEADNGRDAGSPSARVPWGTPDPGTQHTSGRRASVWARLCPTCPGDCHRAAALPPPGTRSWTSRLRTSPPRYQAAPVWHSMMCCSHDLLTASWISSEPRLCQWFPENNGQLQTPGSPRVLSLHRPLRVDAGAAAVDAGLPWAQVGVLVFAAARLAGAPGERTFGVVICTSRIREFHPASDFQGPVNIQNMTRETLLWF